MTTKKFPPPNPVKKTTPTTSKTPSKLPTGRRVIGDSAPPGKKARRRDPVGFIFSGRKKAGEQPRKRVLPLSKLSAVIILLLCSSRQVFRALFACRILLVRSGARFRAERFGIHEPGGFSLKRHQCSRCHRSKAPPGAPLPSCLRSELTEAVAKPL